VAFLTALSTHEYKSIFRGARGQWANNGDCAAAFTHVSARVCYEVPAMHHLQQQPRHCASRASAAENATRRRRQNAFAVDIGIFNFAFATLRLCKLQTMQSVLSL